MAAPAAAPLVLYTDIASESDHGLASDKPCTGGDPGVAVDLARRAAMKAATG